MTTTALRPTSLPTTAPARRCAVYLRISLDHSGEGLAVDRQREDALELAERRGWTVVGEYVDSITASQRTVRRPAYDRLVSDYGAGLFDAVVCYDLDRLTRQPRQLEDWIDAAEGRGLALVTVNGEADLSTDAGRLFARIKAAVARAESERKGARQSRANRQRAERGELPTGNRLTGYELDGSVREEEAATVRELFDGFSKGESLRGLATRYGVAPSTLRDTLTNPRYAGRRVYKGAVVSESARWPALVSGELFDIVQARLSDPRRKTNHVGTARKHLGSGFYVCECQTELVEGDRRPLPSAKTVIGSKSPGSQGDAYRYRCRVCTLSRTGNAVDAYVLGNLLARLSEPDALAALAPQPADVSELLREREAINARLASLASLVADGTLTAEAVRAAAEPLHARMAEVQRRIGAASTPPVLAGLEDVLDRLEEVLPTLSVDRLRALASAFMRVTLHRSRPGVNGFDPESVTITWRGGE